MSRYDTVSYLTAPSSWASYLINGDGSGLDEGELDAILAWLERIGQYRLDDRKAHRYPVSCEDAGFVHWHDAWLEAQYAADCQTYAFLPVEG